MLSHSIKNTRFCFVNGKKLQDFHDLENSIGYLQDLGQKS